MVLNISRWFCAYHCRARVLKYPYHAKCLPQNFARVLCLSQPHLMAKSVTQNLAIALCPSLPHRVAKWYSSFGSYFGTYFGKVSSNESSQTCLLKSTMRKMPKGLRGPTLFEVRAPRVRLQRLVLPPWAGPKRVGGDGPPQGLQ